MIWLGRVSACDAGICMHQGSEWVCEWADAIALHCMRMHEDVASHLMCSTCNSTLDFHKSMGCFHWWQRQPENGFQTMLIVLSQSFKEVFMHGMCGHWSHAFLVVGAMLAYLDWTIGLQRYGKDCVWFLSCHHHLHAWAYSGPLQGFTIIFGRAATAQTNAVHIHRNEYVNDALMCTSCPRQWWHVIGTHGHASCDRVQIQVHFTWPVTAHIFAGLCILAKVCPVFHAVWPFVLF